MKTYDEVKQEAEKFFDENFTVANYSYVERELFVSGYCKGHLEGMKDMMQLKESEATHA